MADNVSIDWSTRSNNELVEALIPAGMDVPKGLPEAIVGRGEGIIDALSAVLLNPAARADEADEGLAWSFSHAFILLGLIGSPKAVRHLLDFFRIEDSTGDLVCEDGPYVLANLGPGALDDIFAYIEEHEQYDIFRGVAASAVMHIGYRWPEERERIARRCSEVLQRSIEREDRELVTELVASWDAIDMPDVRDLIDRAFDQQLVYLGTIDRDDVLRTRREKSSWIRKYQRDVDLWHFFSERFFSECRRRQAEDRARQSDRQGQSGPDDDFSLDLAPDWRTRRRTGQKVGRNDPCPCGSGKKHKKCCGR